METDVCGLPCEIVWTDDCHGTIKVCSWCGLDAPFSIPPAQRKNQEYLDQVIALTKLALLDRLTRAWAARRAQGHSEEEDLNAYQRVIDHERAIWERTGSLSHG